MYKSCRCLTYIKLFHVFRAPIPAKFIYALGILYFNLDLHFYIRYTNMIVKKYTKNTM